MRQKRMLESVQTDQYVQYRESTVDHRGGCCRVGVVLDED